MDQIIDQLLTYWRGIWRRRWYVIGVAWLIAVVGWGSVHSLPDEYQAKARVYVDTQSLLSPLLGGMTVQPRVEQQLDVMTRTLLSRPNLEEVARRSDLDLRADSPAAMERLISNLEDRLQLSGSSRQNLYTITYNHHDPALARNVVQSLLNIFVERGIGGARDELEKPQAFIQKQLSHYRERMSELEEQIKEFKQANGELLAGDSGNYYSKLEAARQRYEEARLALQEARQRQRSYEGRLEGTELTLLEPSLPAGSGTSELDRRIAEINNRLADLRMRYTDRHPDVRSLTRLVADLEAQRDERKRQAASSAPDYGGDRQVSNYMQELQLSLAEAESRVASLRARVSEYRERYEALKGQVDKIPEVEAQYSKLQTEYKRVKDNHDKLMAKGERAQMSEEVVNTTNSVEFRVIDPPFVPKEPVGPRRAIMASGVLVFSLGAGTGLALLLSQLRATVDSRQTLARLSNRVVLGTVSRVESPAEVRRRWLGWLAFGISLASLVAAYAAVLAFFQAG